MPAFVSTTAPFRFELLPQMLRLCIRPRTPGKRPTCGRSRHGCTNAVHEALKLDGRPEPGRHDVLVLLINCRLKGLYENSVSRSMVAASELWAQQSAATSPARIELRPCSSRHSLYRLTILFRARSVPATPPRSCNSCNMHLIARRAGPNPLPVTTTVPISILCRMKHSRTQVLRPGHTGSPVTVFVDDRPNRVGAILAR